MDSEITQEGKCIECGKETATFCDKCQGWICEKHITTKEGMDFCNKCKDL